MSGSRGEMFSAHIDARVLKKPRLIFTIEGQTASKAVLDIIEHWREDQDEHWDIETRVFANAEAVANTFQNGHRPEDSIVVFDGTDHRRHFRYVCYGRKEGQKSSCSIPTWAQGVQWGVGLNPRLPTIGQNGRQGSAAKQLRADFGRHFETRVHVEHRFPWGKTKAGETLPNRPRLRDEINIILKNLQNGPDMADEVFEAVKGRIPAGQTFSWIRVPDRTATVNREMMERCLDAMRGFEICCSELLEQHRDVGDRLMLGVTMDPAHPELRDCYLHPKVRDERVTHWSVRRPDMHVCGERFVASENDEMPGGFTDCFHIDRSYAINMDGWRATFNWLCSQGPLLFVVSSEWSKGYITSMRWMAEQMQAMGYPAYLIHGGELNRLHINNHNVTLELDNQTIVVGTIWRQFPIFETKGKFAELVVASQDGRVRMVPEFAHFGNKSWFALFHERNHFFREHLTAGQFETLTMLIPSSHLVVPNTQINITIAGTQLTSYHDLINAPDALRDRLVLKITGANDLAARSYGVFMGHAQKREAWIEWLSDRARKHEPFIVQERFQASEECIAVYNTASKAAEPFPCKVLVRPWVVADRYVTSHTACTPHYTTKVHGMVDMAVQPIELSDPVGIHV